MSTATLPPAVPTSSVESAPEPAAAPGYKPLREDAKVIGLVGLAHASSHFSHLLLAPLFPVFVKEFGLSFAQLGLLGTVFFAISGTGQALSGFLVDRVGARPVLFASIVCFFLAALTGSMADGYTGLMAVAVLAGLGNAPFHPVDFSILNQRVSPARLGYAYSVHGLCGNLGWALTPVFLMVFAQSNWRVGYVGAMALYVVVLVVLWLNRQRLHTEVVTHAPGTAGVASDSGGLGFLKLPVVWWCFSFFLLSTMTLAVVQNFASPILQAVHHVSFEAATSTITAYMICGAFGMLVGGFVAARMPLHSDRVVALCMTAGAALMALAATGWLGSVGTMAVLAITGFAVGVGGPSRDMMIKRATPKGATGRVYGTVYSGLDTGFALAPLLFGALMDKGWFAATLMAGAATLLLSVFAALGVGRRIPQS
ncbi:MFS transporter [Ottowia sp.]|uniref:MFS transporter n=1 Tax=Ottowia sp. TaxID=1898956 RepID=UPI003A899085